MEQIENVPGLWLQRDVISPEYERDVINWIDSRSWSSDLKRRTQQMGYTYNYQSRKIIPTDEKISGKALEIAEWLSTNNILSPDQCIINEYTQNQGIGAHTDLVGFGPRIISLSLGFPTNFIFRNISTKEEVKIDVPNRSLLIMEGEARSHWTHEIPALKSYTVNGVRISKPENYRRISMTYRTVL